MPVKCPVIPGGIPTEDGVCWRYIYSSFTPAKHSGVQKTNFSTLSHGRDDQMISEKLIRSFLGKAVLDGTPPIAETKT